MSLYSCPWRCSPMWIRHPEPTGSRRATPPGKFQQTPGHPPITMYSGFVPVCLQLLGGLKTVLQNAEEHATVQKWDTTVVLNLRLFPDMFPLERQVRQVCTHSCGAGRVAGISLPSFVDHDNSFAEMQARIDKTADFLKGLRADQ